MLSFVGGIETRRKMFSKRLGLTNGGVRPGGGLAGGPEAKSNHYRTTVSLSVDNAITWRL